MGSTTSTPVRTSPPSTPASTLFNIQPPRPRSGKRLSQLQPCPRRSIFAADENEPDDILDASPHGGVLLGWSRTETGNVIPQIRTIPLGTPLDDTIFNSPRIPWRGRAHSPAPSARSIPRLRQLSMDSLRSAKIRELRVTNGSRPPSVVAEEKRRSTLWQEIDEESLSDDDSFDWDVFPPAPPAFEIPTGGYVTGTAMKREISMDSSRYSTLKRAKSTNDSGYSTMVPSTIIPDSWSCSTVSVDPWWWEEAAGYTTIIIDDSNDNPRPTTTTHYLRHERKESAYISNLLRNHPDDEWDEWRTDLTNLLQFSISKDLEIPPPVPPKDVPSSPSLDPHENDRVY